MKKLAILGSTIAFLLLSNFASYAQTTSEPTQKDSPIDTEQVTEDSTKNSQGEPKINPTDGEPEVDPTAKKPGPFYWIIAEHSGKALMPENHSKNVGTRIVQMSKGNFGAQHWRIRHISTDSNGQSVRKFENRHSKLCIWAYSTAQGQILKQHGCESGTDDARKPEWRVSNKHEMWAGRPFTTWSEYSSKCMDVANASVADYTSVGQYTCHGGPNQKFRVQYVPGT
ncbi:hypothetical protein CAL7716_018140 [Calothrix sp. PCC 7716]|nr:hypothetical protein CAL7716_018140 [Calothrix sp. PCC 7716]